MIRRTLATLSLALLCGCFETKDELILEADGSGRIRLETRLRLADEALAAVIGRLEGQGAGTFYPPLTEGAAKMFFPPNDFVLSVKEEKGGATGRIIRVEAAFKDINVLLASPYGKAHDLSLNLEKGRLELRARAGTEVAARLADMKDDGRMWAREIPGLAELQTAKGEMRSEFRVTLPAAIISGNGMTNNRSMTWSWERAKLTNAMEYAEKLAEVLEVRCAADGLSLTPVTPPRLALRPFQELLPSVVAGRAPAPDPVRVAAAAKFEPYAIQVTRSFDLSGDGSARGNTALLIGAIVLPGELAPSRWSEVKLEEVLDAKGNNLRMNGDRAASFLETGPIRGAGQEIGPGQAPQGGSEKRKMVSFRFFPPAWKVTAIARLKGSATLEYAGGAQHVVKLTNAVPAEWIKNITKEEEMQFDDSPRPFNDSTLAELGLVLNFHMGMAQPGLTILMLQGSTHLAMLSDIQVFDRQGRPWPTFWQQQSNEDEESFTLSIAGHPSPPLSLALRVTRVGGNVTLPILLEKFPVRQK